MGIEHRVDMLASHALSARHAAFNANAISSNKVSSPVPAARRSGMEIVAKKKWEKQALTPRGLPVRIPMHVKTKGKVTNVVEVFTKTGEVLCKDVNVKTKHVKPRGEGETGQIIQREFPIHHSNVMHYSEAKSVRSRIGTKEEGGKKVRVLKKTGEVLAN